MIQKIWYLCKRKHTKKQAYLTVYKCTRIRVFSDPYLPVIEDSVVIRENIMSQRKPLFWNMSQCSIKTN